MEDDQAPEAHSVFPFVVGCGRSGTTILRAILDAHPNVAVPYESYFVVPLLRRRRRFERRRSGLGSLPAGARRRLAIPTLGTAARGGPCGCASTSPVVDGGGDPMRVPGLRRSCREVSLCGQDTRVRPQHPAPGVFLPWPARFVHVIRDGRSVALSYLEQSWGPSSVVKGASYWQRNVRAGRRAGGELGPHRYLEVRYEDLVTAPEGQIRRLCQFVDLEFDPPMVDYFTRADTVLGTKAAIGDARAPAPAAHAGSPGLAGGNERPGQGAVRGGRG